MKIFVGNLAARTDEQDLRDVFMPYGEVTHVNVARQSASGTSRRFAFVDVALDGQGKTAIAGLHAQELHGQVLTVKQAHRRLLPL
jgi:RNA recognition motif-containing protein